ncbi:MAG: ferredoxin-type protein NapG [Magnetospiraceae bacterium]
MARSPRQSESGTSRRSFLETAAKGAAGTAICASGIGFVARSAPALPTAAIRPPGALDESDFMASCVRCGLCARDCPYDILLMAPSGVGGPSVGTPYFEARTGPCEMCDDIPCVVACPTGALDRSLTDITKARMGVAVLVDTENCLNHLGLRCDVCYRVCPMIGEAITLERSHNPRTGKHALLIPTVHAAACTGCGICEQRCILPEAAIKVLPEHVARGRLGEHYRLGWEEKRAKGEALIQGIVDLPDRGYAPALTDPGSGMAAEPTPGGGFKGFKP